ncbi:MAG: xanthine dehydrogenase family protein molybdopterin-binding subunit [Proteobacteria bacterium]|nr:xanthine dehydrogenase family protein molybdopterin-binding subunit [Pseudomonadota bacterium]
MYFGQPLRRREDQRFLTGKGQYSDDYMLPGMTYAAFVRSPHAHADILSLSTDKAAAMPGVLGVLTAEDWHADGNGELVCVHPMPFSDGRPMNEKLKPVLAGGKVCHVGDAVACVIAETRFAALDGAEAVAVEYQALPSVSKISRALDDDAPVIHDDIGTNLVFEIEKGDGKAVDAIFANAHHVTEMTLDSNRVAGNPLEPRVFLSQYDEHSGQYTLWCGSQIPHYFRRWLAKYLLHEAEHRIRVITPDVGGGFGLKIHLAEGAVVTWASRKIGRPVKWAATRSESFMSDSQARDHHTRAKMAFDANGRIIGMKIDTIAALGGYLSQFAPSIPGNSYPQTVTGLYTTPAVHLRVRGAYSNTVSVDAYRGSGRPEATWVNERLLENGAREMGLDVVEIRRKNLIQADQFPYPNLLGRTYDSGDPPALLDNLLEIADYQALREEQQKLRANGVLMGIGLASFLDKSGTGSSRNLAVRGGLHGGYESASVRVHSDGKVTVFSGSHSHGQGHATAFIQLAADALGIPMENIELVQGDTDRVPFGNGTWGSRSASVGGVAIVMAAEKVIDKARTLAAHVLECAPKDIDYEDGVFRVRGTDRIVDFTEIADIAYHGARLPEDRSLTPGLEETVFYEPKDTNDPQAMHLAVVIVDAESGVVRIRDYFTSDDCGRIINPMIVEGQIHGGLAQGIGQAMMEQVIYGDEDSVGAEGQLLSGSFMDYAMPRASDMPENLSLVFQEIPCPSNILGVKGGSETGTIGPPAALGNAVVDALWHLGVRHVELPITSQNVWRALKKAITV